ncbi:MAG: hypothetical protein QXW65_03395 [Candidatus Pacearchaeota archaeon]
MFEALSGSVGFILKKPIALLPVFLAMFLVNVSSVLFQQKLLDVIFILITNNVSLLNPTHVLFYMAKNDPPSLFYFFIYAITTLTIFSITGVYYCHLLLNHKKGSSISNALGFSFSSIWNIIVLLGIQILFLLVMVFGFFTLAFLPLNSEWLFLTLFFIYFVFVFLIGFRLFMFVFPALAQEKTNAKMALKKSWAFVNRNFWPSLLLLFVLFLVLSLVFLIQYMILEQFDDTLIIFSIKSITNTFAVTFSLGALTLYYSKHNV